MPEPTPIPTTIGVYSRRRGAAGSLWSPHKLGNGGGDNIADSAEKPVGNRFSQAATSRHSSDEHQCQDVRALRYHIPFRLQEQSFHR